MGLDNLKNINDINIRNKFESSVADLVFLVTIGSWLAGRVCYLLRGHRTLCARKVLDMRRAEFYLAIS